MRTNNIQCNSYIFILLLPKLNNTIQFSYRKRVLLLSFWQREETVNTVKHCETLLNFADPYRTNIGFWRRESFSCTTMLDHIYFSCRAIVEYLIWFGFIIAYQFNYSPDYRPSNLSSKFKGCMYGKHFSDHMETKVEKRFDKNFPTITKFIEPNGNLMKKYCMMNR